MSDAASESKLVGRAEAALGQAPLREPEWDTLAARIEGALASAGPTDDSLLLPPLPESIEDESLPVTTAKPPAVVLASEASSEVALATPEVATEPRPVDAPSSEREGGLAELARAAIARRGTKEAVSLAKESLAIAAQGREAATAAATPAPPVAAAEPPIIVTERARRTLPPARRGAGFDTRGPWIGVAVAAVGLAAGFGLYLSSQRAPQVVEVPSAQTAVPAATTAAVAEATPNAPKAPVAAVAPNALPAEGAGVGTPEAAAPVVAADALAREHSAAKTSAPAAEPRTVVAPSGGSAKPEKIVLEDDHPTPVPTPASKPASSGGMRPAELNAQGGVSDRPSTGAAQAAVGAVLGAARSCIAGQPQASSATIVFGSNGEVSAVNVSGPVQGTPAASCIQSALKKARVQPFAAPSFSLGVTVRPP